MAVDSDTMQGIVATLELHADALQDLAEIRQKNPKAVAQIARLIQQIRKDPALMDRLTSHNWGVCGNDPFNVKLWIEQQNKHKRNLWRLRCFDMEWPLSQYRLIYAFRPKLKQHVVLGVVPRKLAYDTSQPINIRIQDTYDRCYR